ncbi:MAG TPA: DoxX family protein [Candidatus Paceibacterota bacterium]
MYTQFQKISLFLLRIAMGSLFFYAGITKVMNPAWSAGGYIRGAKNFVDFYNWLLQPNILPIINFLNAWGLTLLGIALVLGLFVRLGSVGGIFLMAMYYLVILDFPYPNAHAYIVDEHIMYIMALLILTAFSAGRVWGLETWCSNLPICSRFPVLRKLLG